MSERCTRCLPGGLEDVAGRSAGAHIVALVQIDHLTQGANVDLFYLRRASEAGHQSGCVPRRTRTKLARLLEQRDTHALRGQCAHDGGTRNTAAYDYDILRTRKAGLHRDGRSPSARVNAKLDENGRPILLETKGEPKPRPPPPRMATQPEWISGVLSKQARNGRALDPAPTRQQELLDPRSKVPLATPWHGRELNGHTYTGTLQEGKTVFRYKPLSKGSMASKLDKPMYSPPKQEPTGRTRVADFFEAEVPLYQ